jgi:hypothetical protein
MTSMTGNQRVALEQYLTRVSTTAFLRWIRRTISSPRRIRQAQHQKVNKGIEQKGQTPYYRTLLGSVGHQPTTP